MGRPAANVRRANGGEKNVFFETTGKTWSASGGPTAAAKNRLMGPGKPRMYVFTRNHRKTLDAPWAKKKSGPPASLAPLTLKVALLTVGVHSSRPRHLFRQRRAPGLRSGGAVRTVDFPPKRGEPAGVETSDGAGSERAAEDIRRRVFGD